MKYRNPEARKLTRFRHQVISNKKEALKEDNYSIDDYYEDIDSEDYFKDLQNENKEK